MATLEHTNTGTSELRSVRIFRHTRILSTPSDRLELDQHVLRENSSYQDNVKKQILSCVGLSVSSVSSQVSEYQFCDMHTYLSMC